MKIKAFIKSQRLYEFFKYCLVGGIAFVADTGTLLLLHRFLLSDFELDLLLFRFTDGRTAAAAAAGFIVGLAVNYVLSVFFVFNRPEQKDKGKTVGAFLVFAAVGIVGLVLTELGMMLGVSLFGDRYLVFIKTVVAAIVLVWNYIGRKIFVYGK